MNHKWNVDESVSENAVGAVGVDAACQHKCMKVFEKNDSEDASEVEKLIVPPGKKLFCGVPEELINCTVQVFKVFKIQGF